MFPSGEWKKLSLFPLHLLKEGRCRYRPERSAARVTDFVLVSKNEEALMHAVATIGPISVGIDAGHESFKLYRGGKQVILSVGQPMTLNSFGGQTALLQG